MHTYTGKNVQLHWDFLLNKYEQTWPAKYKCNLKTGTIAVKPLTPTT